MENAPSRDTAQATKYLNALADLEITIDRVARGVQVENHPLVDRTPSFVSGNGPDNSNDVQTEEDDVITEPEPVINGVSSCGSSRVNPSATTRVTRSSNKQNAVTVDNTSNDNVTGNIGERVSPVISGSRRNKTKKSNGTTFNQDRNRNEVPKFLFPDFNDVQEGDEEEQSESGVVQSEQRERPRRLYKEAEEPRV